jgi:hypothetical protein
MSLPLSLYFILQQIVWNLTTLWGNLMVLETTKQLSKKKNNAASLQGDVVSILADEWHQESEGNICLLKHEEISNANDDPGIPVDISCTLIFFLYGRLKSLAL